MNQFIRYICSIFIILLSITACAGKTGSDSGGSTSYVLGTLPNGSQVTVNMNNIPIIKGDTATEFEVSMGDGSGTESYLFDFSNSGLLQSQAFKKATTSSLSVNPSTCTLGTSKSKFPQSCKLSLVAPSTTPNGTYTITPTVEDESSNVQTLSPITVLVSGTTFESSKDITSFMIDDVNATIVGTNISVTLPFGTAKTALVATYITSGTSVSIGSTVQINGETANDFTNPVVYTVTAEDGSTQDYTVTVTIAANTAKAITTFSINGRAGEIVNNTIAVTLPYGTAKTGLVATFDTTGESVTVDGIEQDSGLTQNDYTNPVTYVIHAADGSIASYVVTVSIAPSDQKQMIAFALNGTLGTIDESRIDVVMPFGSSISNLTATYNFLGDKVVVNNVEQVNGQTSHDFTNPIVYTVYADDGSSRTYTVNVEVAISSAKDILSVTIGGNGTYIITQTPEGFANATNNADDLWYYIIGYAPYATDLSAVTINFVTTGESVSFYDGMNDTVIENGDQIDLSQGEENYSLIVHAADGSSRVYNLGFSNSQDWMAQLKYIGFDGMLGSEEVYGDMEDVVGYNVIMPYGTDLTSLVANFVIEGDSAVVNSVTQVSGVTENDFSSTVRYDVNPADGTASSSSYSVTVITANTMINRSFSPWTLQSNVVPSGESQAWQSSDPDGVIGMYVSGPQSISFQWKNTSADSAVGLFIDGELVDELGGNNDWTTVNYQIDGEPNQLHLIAWYYIGTVSQASYVAGIQLTPVVGLSSYKLGNQRGVFDGNIINVTLPEGTDISNLIATYTTEPYDAHVTVNGTNQLSGVSSNNFSSPVTYLITHDNITESYLVNVDFIPFGYSTGGAASWSLQSSIVPSGESQAWQSGVISNNQSTYLQYVVSGAAGTLSFDWKVSSEQGWDDLSLYIDGELVNIISGEVNWTTVTHALSSGVHIIKWVYQKDDSGFDGSDTAWVGKISYTQ